MGTDFQTENSLLKKWEHVGKIKKFLLTDRNHKTIMAIRKNPLFGSGNSLKYKNLLFWPFNTTINDSETIFKMFKYLKIKFFFKVGTAI